jgi:hypothetical protein
MPLYLKIFHNIPYANQLWAGQVGGCAPALLGSRPRR